MNLPQPTAIIFDWDNTLVDTWPVIHAALNATLEVMEKPLWTFEMTKQRVRKSMRDSFPELFGERWQEAGEIYQAHYRSQHLTNLHPLPGAYELLESVQASGIFSAVVSNKKGPNLRQEVEHLGWGGFFDVVVGADDAARDKPFVDPVMLAFRGCEQPLGRHVWFVGDSDIDLECAQNTGCTAVLYGPTPKEHGHFSDTHFQNIPYHAYVEHHSDLARLFQAVQQ